MKILEIENLSKSYNGKTNALSDCNLTLDVGKICAVVGESGSGKSTLLRLIAGLERPSGGVIQIKEKIVSDDHQIVAPQQRNVGLVFQDFALFPHLTVEQNIVFGLKNYEKETVASLLEMIKMAGYEKRYPSELSGGQEQRVALARTLAIKPELLLLDEPFSSLDAGLKSELRQEIRRIVKEVGTSMIFITHDITDAIDIADEIIFLHDGVIVKQCPIDQIFKNITHPYIEKRLVELKNNATAILNMFE